ncbi:response regulator [Heyndrickxia sporothermodurans]|uniref:Response regulator n=1 Tax=Heyndrickxia sporothermodurans TaxID=46224 RepID=A0AB37H859_9BACI|nr:response regulator [Heyndrickxia sporothermodurans]MBL5771578.1 response regulator [Heyndrickxia sporothermodurans]MBL5774800.1 response regulator [Heyndrickxia sporothermodurans]MBL5792742.1 response regulator [Heyndrickxia sporothermodurans]MBL5796106.1 response regulator [Heyndrickxia sporothermodurans]MBL5807013.1 response regulator [Heyndrickxia sporothermodurans]
MENKMIHVLLIDDDPMVREVNKGFIESINGYKVIGEASNGEEGIQLAKERDVDLVILDIYMPKIDGINTLQQIRAQQLNIDVIVVSAAKDNETINIMLQNGAVDYIIKPFKFDRIKKSLENYQYYKRTLKKNRTLSQDELDAMMNMQQTMKRDIHLPKGLNMFTLQQIMTYMKEANEAKSAGEVANSVGIARVTARRYLDYLEKTGIIHLDVQYGNVGRPVNRYTM